MWSKGLNDSFSAISGHISTLKQSVNQSLIGADATDAASAERRRLVAEVALLRREVRRHRRREASPPAQDFRDVALDDEGDGEDDDPHDDDDEWSAEAERLLAVEAELEKTRVDREHWRALAKDETKCRELSSDCRLRDDTIQQLERQLEELDAQHEQALDKVLELKRRLELSNDGLTRRVHELEARLESRDDKEDDDRQSMTSSLAGDGKREEPEGAPLDESAAQDCDSAETRLQALLDAKTREAQEWESRMKAADDERQRLISRQKEMEALLADREALKSALQEKELSAERMRRDYDHLLRENRRLGEEVGRRAPHSAEEALRRMEETVRAKERELTEWRARAEDSEVERMRAELSRLKEHLVCIEENYTQELVSAAERVESLRREVAAGERMREELLTADQRRDDETRALRTEREMARNEASRLEDKVQQYSASVSNLQLVVEHIQRENERKAREAERRAEEALAAERRRTAEALEGMRRQEARVLEAAEALSAASRLSESLDAKEATIEALRADGRRHDALVADLRAQMASLVTSSEGKVDKQIIKSLIIGYFVTPEDKRAEVQRLLARFLDFNQQEMDRTRIEIGRKRPNEPSDSLSLKFVQFLEQESKRDSHSAPTAGSAKADVTRDLSKSLIQSSQRMNPFLTSMSTPMTPSLGSRHSSANSSSDNLNQLLMAPAVAPFAP
ncbi:unnamed protein product, partial [Oppiella nova]